MKTVAPGMHELKLEILSARAGSIGFGPQPELPPIDRASVPSRHRKLLRLAAVELAVRTSPGGNYRAVMLSRIDWQHVLSAAYIFKIETPHGHDPALWACYRAVRMARQEIRSCMQTRRRA